MTTSSRDAIETLPREPDASGSRANEAPPGVIEPGALLLGRFEVGARLGAGGMGIVHEAWDRELSTAVALKFLHRFDSPALYRLKHEFRTMNALGPHPNLVAPSGVFCDRGAWFVSMELVRGESWLRYTRPGGQLDLVRLRGALAQLAEGLRAMHGAGKMHRDLKPSNVLVSAGGRW
jgi:serine/threonine protein kinase